MKKLTSLFINLQPGVLFLFTFMVTFKWYSSTDPSRAMISSVINIIGEAGLLLWLYSVCYRSSGILKKKDISFSTMRTFHYTFLAILVAGILLHIVSSADSAVFASQSDIDQGEQYTYNQITYGLQVIIVVSILFIYINSLKLLSSAEKGRERSFSDYYSTFFFLLLLPWIAVWFIQPRVKKVLKA